MVGGLLSLSIAQYGRSYIPVITCQIPGSRKENWGREKCGSPPMCYAGQTMTWSEIDDNYMRYLKHFLHPMQARVLGEAPKALNKEVQRNTKYSGTDGERELNHGGREEPLTLCEGETQ
jgi:hypothetical protein